MSNWINEIKIKQNDTGNNNKTKTKKPYSSSIKYIVNQNFTTREKNVTSKKDVFAISSKLETSFEIHSLHQKFYTNITRFHSLKISFP